LWNSINGGDFDGDGDVDYIVGNVGLNARFKGNEEFPAKILAGDFDGNGNYDAIPFIYLPKSNTDKKLVFAPYNAKDDMGKQLPIMQGRYTTFNEYATATFENIFDDDKRKLATEFTLNYSTSVYVENLGNGKFKLKPLPVYAQFAPINGTVIEDFDSDGNLDALLVGNNFGNELFVGRYDASNGLLLLGDGKGNFTPKLNTGFAVTGDAKALVKLVDLSGEVKVLASQNRGVAKLFGTALKGKIIEPKPTTTQISYELNGKKVIKEIYYGASYLSQSSRRVVVPENATNIVLK
ncbi:MAG: RNA-binding protein, partial [Spirosomaceae bacterium]|nr:RNA-binding protein [Spirosomataceae bacterium]